MEQWYALYTVLGAERKVALILEGNGIKTYLPEIREVAEKRRGRLVPYFPCYLFMCIDLDIAASTLWQWTPGLRNIVAFGGVPAAVPTPTIELIRQKLDLLNSVSTKPRPQFNPGDVVRISKGPLMDMLALFEGPTKPAERVSVLLNFLGRSSRVRLDVADLEIAPAMATIEPQKRPRRSRGRGRPIQAYPYN